MICQTEEAVRRVEELGDQIFTLCKTIHENPELGFQEFKASRMLTGFLEEQGFTVTRGCGGLETAFRAERKGKEGGPVIGLLCEYDALPAWDMPAAITSSPRLQWGLRRRLGP